MILAAALAGLAFAGAAAPPEAAHADVVWLLNGDRLTGAIVAETPKSLRLKMPFASVLIPKARVRRIVRADGTEQVLHAAEPAEPARPPAATAPPPARLVLVITGASFWQAWDARHPPPDPTLRLELRIDEEPVAIWSDARLDPEDLPGANVNTFAFTSGDEARVPGPGVTLAAPEVQPGRVLLRVDVPGAAGENRRLRLAYQANEGTADSPAWRDVTTAASVLTVRPDAPTLVQVRQGRGGMEFVRGRMRGVDTFRVELTPE